MDGPPRHTALPRPSAVEWLLLLLGLGLTIEYAWLLDDAYVYFRYIDNFLVYDFGLVYNEGEYVEGGTSTLWLAILMGLRALGVDYWLGVRAVGLLCFAGFWWGLVLLDRDLGPRDAERARHGLINLPLIFLALSYATLTYFTSGVGSPVVQLAAVAFALVAVRPERRVAGLMVALSPLLRPELALAVLLSCALAWWRSRRFPLWIVTWTLLTSGSWLLFRIYYYADLFPNTFYLKDVALYAQGLAYMHQSLATYAAYPTAAMAVALAWLLRRRGVDVDTQPRVAMLVVAVAVSLYVIRVGGDPRHHRFVAFPFCLAAASMAGLGDWAVQQFAPRVRASLLAGGALLAAVALGTLYPPQLSAHPLTRLRKHRQVDRINDSQLTRGNKKAQPPSWSLEPLDYLQTPQLMRIRESFESGYRGTNTMLACRVHYWRIDHRVIHGAGFTDGVLAHITVPRPHNWIVAHNSNLWRLAKDVAAIYQGRPGYPGMYRDAVERGVAPAWVEPNLGSIELIERKVFNEHDFFENLRLALTPVPRIHVALDEIAFDPRAAPGGRTEAAP